MFVARIMVLISSCRERHRRFYKLKIYCELFMQFLDVVGRGMHGLKRFISMYGSNSLYG